jgi:hypothetical protein
MMDFKAFHKKAAAKHDDLGLDLAEAWVYSLMRWNNRTEQYHQIKTLEVADFENLTPSDWDALYLIMAIKVNKPHTIFYTQPVNHIHKFK